MLNEEVLNTIQLLVDELLDKADPLTSLEERCLDALGEVIIAYEQNTPDESDIYGGKMLNSLMIQAGVTNKDLVHIFGSEEEVIQARKDNYEFNEFQLRYLASFFKVSKDVFLPVSCNKGATTKRIFYVK